MAHEQGKSSGIEHAAHKVMDTVGGLAGQAGAALTNSADGFARMGAIADMYEIEAAQIAQERSTTPTIRQVADQIFRDHTETLSKLQDAIVRSAKVGPDVVPAQLDTRHASLIKHLREAPADKFDKTYIDQQFLAHEEAVTLMHQYREQGDDPVLQAHAVEVSPIFEKHLEEVKRVRSSL